MLISNKSTVNNIILVCNTLITTLIETKQDSVIHGIVSIDWPYQINRIHTIPYHYH